MRHPDEFIVPSEMYCVPTEEDYYKALTLAVLHGSYPWHEDTVRLAHIMCSTRLAAGHNSRRPKERAHA